MLDEEGRENDRENSFGCMAANCYDILKKQKTWRKYHVIREKSFSLRKVRKMREKRFFYISL